MLHFTWANYTKLSVVRTLMERIQCLVSDAVNREWENAHIEDAQRMRIPKADF